MNRSLGRRFLPLGAIIVAQLLIIALAPSKAPTSQELAAGGGTGATGVDADGDGLDDGLTGGTSDTVPGGDGAIDPATGAPVDGSGGGGDGGTGGGGGEGGPPAGDTSHCVAGRQFDPKIDFYAPPCTPAFTGDNGGATYQGVTKDKITIVRFISKGSDAVDAILKAQGAYVAKEQYEAFHVKAAKFINEKYELYGRQVEIKTVQGTCNSIPPDVACLRGEMRQMVSQYKPYAVYWNSSLCSACFDELSKLRTVNVGGWHFRDSFNQQRAPYHWDVQMSGTKMAQHAGRWYCSQLHGKPAKYAGSANRTQDLRDNPRSLGVISTDDPENKGSIEVELKSELGKCGTGYGSHVYFYEQDLTTADQQRRAAVLKMNPVGSGENAATSIMCFCDLVAPSFLYSEEQQQNYYPENLMVGSGFMDADASAQAYMGTLGCPLAGSKPCNFEDAFGLSSINAQEHKFKDTGQRIWAAGGGAGDAPFESVTAEWEYLNLLSSIIQAAGPNLNPKTMEAGAFKMGARGDANHVTRAFSPGNYAWNQDMRMTYWSPSKISPYNDEAGTYVQVGQGRIPVTG
ncbi:MAG: hypothetical protein QOG87_3323, partial [Actinomycetota bacterium]